MTFEESATAVLLDQSPPGAHPKPVGQQSVPRKRKASPWPIISPNQHSDASHSGEPDGSDHALPDSQNETVAADNSSQEGRAHRFSETQMTLGAAIHPGSPGAISPRAASYPGEHQGNGNFSEVGARTSRDAQGEPVADLRFADPLVLEIVQLHRLRRRWTKAKNALILQGKALCRAFCGGDKKAGSDAFDRLAAGKAIEADAVLEMALSPFLPGIERFETELALIENQLVRLAKKLPIAPWVDSVRGLGWSSVSAIVGEAGDLSKYPTVSGVWKRLGLAVIDGERQRKCADAEKALAHGYSPERRSVVWVMADAMAKHQRAWVDKETGEVKKEAGPYGVILETEKAKAVAKEWPLIRAERHAKRLMSKAMLRDMTLAWRSL